MRIAYLALSTVALAVGAVAAPTARSKALHLVVYGDSFSDTGNTFKLSNGTWPVSAYYKGHFSNGPVWQEIAAQELGVTRTNEAFGGATTDNKLVQGFSGPTSNIPVPGVEQQAAIFAASVHGKTTARPYEVDAIWAGANDWFFNSNLTGDDVAKNIMVNVETLVNDGARTIIIFNQPPLNRIPFFQGAAAEQALFATITTDFNAAIVKRAAAFHHPSTTVHVFDVNTVYKHQVFPKFTASDASNACLNSTSLVACTDPDNHIYWDVFHPTRVVHKIIGTAFAEFVRKNVPGY
ncbi:SGNH hydrolase-type esterase domain-containing protein [Blyttiomyces helicus]|uniref:SGNH hydrolase-type esterase domain-containing protein n=1 Tax=Blyttiomyces helicus TaxID=388810 RepID=A0A4P9WE58_9FUNG|nr:SGNH hydrolase-type esterase domain-containing protein [Blyttiomyces helicus]|eukprot:RKO88656.1 SGNH hydrolase-type esterase domain-containing protein [Blyttiomyces helicus]